MYKKWTNILIVGFLFILLISVRFFEAIFYDPMQVYFESDYLSKALPNFDKAKLFVHIFLRYVLNSMISLLIIWVAFRRKSYVQFSIYFFVFALFVLLFALWIILSYRFENNYILGYYVRRFLIHPIFVLLLLPAFYYQEHLRKT